MGDQSTAAPELSKQLAQRNGAQAWIANVMILAGVALMVFAVTSLLLMGRPAGAANVPVAPPRPGAPLGNFSLTDLQGNTVRLSDYAGRPILVNAWATWCPPCRAEMPALEAFYQKHRDSGFVVLAINVGESKELAGAFADEYRLSFPVLLDSDQRLSDRMAIHDFPTSIMVGRDGTVRQVHIGMISPDQLDQAMLPLLAP